MRNLKVVHFILLFVFILFFSISAFSKSNIVVLNFYNKYKALTDQEVDFIEEYVRGFAVNNLSKEEYMIYTNENLLQMLEANAVKLCESEGDCEVETMRLIQAKYGITGNVVKMGDNINIVLKIYDSSTGSLLGSSIATGIDANAIQKVLEGTTKKLFSYVSPKSEQPTNENKSELPSAESKSDLSADIIPEGFGQVLIHSTPDKAEILTIDGKLIGKTPFKFNKKPGDYQFIVMKKGFHEEKVNITVEDSVISVEHLKLIPAHKKIQPERDRISDKKNQSKVVIRTYPPDAAVYTLNDKMIGVTPLKFLWKPGKDVFIIKKQGFNPERLKVFLDPNKINKFEIPLVNKNIPSNLRRKPGKPPKLRR
ncbi:MAG: PEGA domain-containing protein [Pseudomonadota bacterium]